MLLFAQVVYDESIPLNNETKRKASQVHETAVEFRLSRRSHRSRALKVRGRRRECEKC